MRSLDLEKAQSLKEELGKLEEEHKALASEVPPTPVAGTTPASTAVATTPDEVFLFIIKKNLMFIFFIL